MSNEDLKIQRRFMETNPSIYPIQREYFKGLNQALVNGGLWPTTTTTSTTTTTTSSTTSSSTTSTSSSTTSTTV